MMKKIISSQEKFHLLTKYEHASTLSKKDFKTIAAFSKDPDAFIRSICAKLLVNFVTPQAKRLLLNLANDKNASVRTEAYDSLSVFPSKKVQKTLKKAIFHEKNKLACSYAILSWADITQTLGVHKKQEKFLKELKKLPKIQKSEHCMLSCYYAKYLFGHKKAIHKILMFLQSADYQIRCSAIHILWELASSDNTSLIQHALEQLLPHETCASVSNNAKELLQFIDMSTK